MKSIVISLPDARERRKRIAQRFVEPDLPFEFVDAVDARELTDADIAAVERPPMGATAFAADRARAMAGWKARPPSNCVSPSDIGLQKLVGIP